MADLPTLLKNSKAIFVGTLIEGEGHSSRHRFRVTEVFKGVKGNYIDLEESIWGPDFKLGAQYLVFASPCWWEGAGGKSLTTYGPCCPTRSLDVRLADVEQLRAEKNRQRMASVYGMLWDRSRREGYRPLTGVIVRLQSPSETFEAKTDDRGVYSFRWLPPGRYQLSADLPAGLAVKDTTQYPHPMGPVEVTRHACHRLDIFVDKQQLWDSLSVAPTFEKAMTLEIQWPVFAARPFTKEDT
jgi:hypothetical protein